MLILRVGDLPLCDAASWRAVGISIEHVGSGREAMEFLKLYEYDLMLLDWDLSDMPATELLRRVRLDKNAVPAIVVGGQVLANIVKALDTGADDYFVHPIHPLEVLARIRAVVRRNHGHSVSSIRVGDVEMNLDRHEVLVRGQKLHLSRREFGVLELLFLKQGVVLNKDVFLSHLYVGLDEPESKALDVIVCRMRKKFLALGVPSIIETVWGCGYMLGDAKVTKPEMAA